MKFSTVAALATLTVTAVARPQLPGWQGNCISQDAADTLVADYAAILGHKSTSLGNFTQTAQIILADDYQEISDSILSLEGLPLGGVTFANKQIYIASEAGAPGVEGITTIDVGVVCPNKIIWQWVFTGLGSGQYEIKGFNYFQLNSQGQIETTYLEFNSIAWGLDTGYQVIFPPSQSSN